MFSRSSSRAHSRSLVATLAATALLAGVLTATDLGPAESAHAHGSFGTFATGDTPTDSAEVGGSVYVSNAEAGTVSVFSSADFSPVTTVTVESLPYNISVTNDGSQVWVSNAGSGTISIIDPTTNTVVDTITTGGVPRQILFTADGERALVLNRGSGTLQQVDIATGDVSVIASSLGQITYGVLSADESMLYLASTSTTGVIPMTLATGVADFDGRIATGLVHYGMALSPDGTEIWVPSYNEQLVTVIDVATLSVVDTIPVVGKLSDVVFSADGELAYLVAETTDTIVLVDVDTREIIVPIAAMNAPSTAMLLESGKLLVLGYFTDVAELIGLEQERLAGANRFATAVAISQKGFPSGADVVFVANGLDFPDALAAGPAAGTLGASLLLTNPTSLPSVVRDEIARLNPSTIYVVGGTGAVSASVEAALKTLQPNVIRLAGASRYQTGAAIVQEAWSGQTVPEVFIATGRNYPDALSAGAVAAGEGIPVILVDGNLSTVPASTLALITELAPAQITIAGGTGVVSAGIMAQLTSQFAGAEVRRLAGADRYATSTAINLDAYPTNTGVIYATGTSFPDALAGAAFAGRADAPVYLVEPGCVTAGGIDAVYEGQATYLFLLGGTGSLSTAVEDLTPCS